MTMYYLSKGIHLVFMAYTILLFVRIASSWVPSWRGQTWYGFVRFYTEPYLQFFQKIIPPIGGVLDLSPVLALFTLRIAESILIGFLR